MTANNTTHIDPELQSTEEQVAKIKALRDMVLSAEKTIQGAKAMLLQLEGKKKTGRPRKVDLDTVDGTVVEGTFDGQIMIGTDGRQYPVPANYASKSKLVEGDMLKLTITDRGAFLYKQVGPIDRNHAIAVVTQDENGNYYVIADGKPFRVLLASITYFRAMPGDEVAIVTSQDPDATWAAIENVIQKGARDDWQSALTKATEENESINTWKKDLKDAKPKEDSFVHSNDTFTSEDTHTLDDWVRDMEEIEKEIKQSAS
ncbi:MAG: hypothetical protein GW815_01180 [Candidatus Moranbacteria bacterium]|nr:hypothetical protein [Candidatus Moranbacteria bacterium]PIP25279.1 MAG: hypothetical protein COX32_04300 [Candidatus Moranbacteria bacterium CG23_combo_of_CG06-09_8_20_14_all_41_28]PIV86565.1 MAG: hypothetical protein COW50_00595 [Candidatus Moranbacteria bacterium CG17_big_fil_post_rev_8_21_14_2_50_41_107]PIW94184.1 MAG: hypothetical protein COZ86_02480 [Candidatus Moranbacteria bacterium CG_4_8_14_3_um_filter_41_13]PJB99896.1 MAG: hypothetical protein CO075_03515 [Candidatus Moranbacteria